MKNPGYFNLVSLGCPKNRVDSEKILHAMISAGFEHTQNQEEARVIIINTCAFIQPAVEESISAILDGASINPDAFLIVAGCLPSRYGKDLADSLPEVDLFVKPHEIEPVAAIIESLMTKDRGNFETRLSESVARGRDRIPEQTLIRKPYEFKRALSTPGYAYVRISDGCDHHCKFCAIPLIRGKLKSESIENIFQEVEHFTQVGVREIVLVAQDLTSYGRDIGLKKGLIQLLEKLGEISGVDWIRLMYLYPSGVSDELLDIISNSKKILPYLDVPIQHIADNVLVSMRRPWRGAQIRKLIESIRKKIPGIVIRTTVMTGFPTETETDFEELKKFISEFELDHVGVFSYFKEEGTPAEELGDPIPRKIKNARARALQSIHSMFIKKKNKRRIGTKEPAIIEGFSEETELLLQGRLWDQAPEIDGKLYITSGHAQVGEIRDVVITGTHGSDIFAEIVE
ncbi:MAG: 30S ribosomal protein S12 methylthiotransferase RimO [Desulfomonilaceae bacterium]